MAFSHRLDLHHLVGLYLSPCLLSYTLSDQCRNNNTQAS